MADFHASVERIGADEAVGHWRAASNTTVFTHPHVLAALAHDVHWWLASESGRPACLWPVCLDADGRVVRPEFSYYVGPFDVTPPDPSPQRRIRKAAAVHEALLGSLTGTYERLAWSTPPGQHDLRPWLWFRSAGRQAVARPRYTAVIDRLDTSSDEDLLRRFRRRGDEYRRANKAGVVQLPSASLDRVKRLYCETLEANGAERLACQRLAAVETVYRLVSEGHGSLVACGFHPNDEVRAVWLFLTAKGRACGILGASEAAWREQRLNAYGTFRTVVTARDQGAACYDFNGANSLERGADKHSYGAEAELYFDLEW